MVRNDRIYQEADGQWYFYIRGGKVSGPFRDQVEAAGALNIHVRNCRARNATHFTWPRHWHLSRFFRRPLHRH